MDNILARLKSFYKAQTIEDPMAIATYVTTRYGIPDHRKYGIAQGIAGKSKAKQWNKPTVTSDSKRKGATAGRMKGTKGLFASRSKKKSVELDKAQNIADTTELAHHLWRGGKVGAGHAGQGSVPSRPWHVYEGGMKDKDRAKEWNPVMNPDKRGYKYDSTGKRIPKKKKKKEPQARVKGKFGRRAGGQVSAQPSFASARGGKDFRRGQSGGKQKAIMNALLFKAHKFGGKPLGWDDLPRDPISFATNVMQDKGFKNTNLSANTDGANTRNKLAQGIRALVNEIPDATKKEIKAGKRSDAKWEKEAIARQKAQERSWEKGKHKGDVDVKKQSIPPALARMLGFGAGWAMSDSFTEAPRGQMTPSQQRDWERLVRSAMRRKKDLRKDGIDSLQSYYKDSSDTYVKRTPIANSLVISKDHAPVPPRQGLVWDEQKSHWTRQEHVGKTVAEVQGKKRVRGSGTGTHERSRAAGGIGGKGSGMSAQAGRRFRSVADVGVVKPHEAKHPGVPKKITRKKLLQHLRGRAGTVRTVH